LKRPTGRLRRLKSRESRGSQNNAPTTLYHEYRTLDRASVVGRLLQRHRFRQNPCFQSCECWETSRSRAACLYQPEMLWLRRWSGERLVGALACMPGLWGQPAPRPQRRAEYFAGWAGPSGSRSVGSGDELRIPWIYPRGASTPAMPLEAGPRSARSTTSGSRTDCRASKSPACAAAENTSTTCRWRSLSGSGSVAPWFGGGALTVCELDVRVGGSWRMVFDAGDYILREGLRDR